MRRLDYADGICPARGATNCYDFFADADGTLVSGYEYTFNPNFEPDGNRAPEGFGDRVGT